MSRLAGVDRVLGILSWVVAGALVVMLFVGPVLVADDEPAAGSPPAAADGGSEDAGGDGAQLFVDNCGSCHTLEAAGTSGVVGPSLDGAGLDSAEVEAVVSEGPGGMPSFSGDLDPAEIEAIAAFVASSSGS